MVLDDVEFLCDGRASAIMLAPEGIAFQVRDCSFTKPKDRAITSTGDGCQGMQVDRCQFLSNEQGLPVQDRKTLGFNVNANDPKIRDNRVVRFRHFCVLQATGSSIIGNHWFLGDDEPTACTRRAGSSPCPTCKTLHHRQLHRQQLHRVDQRARRDARPSRSQYSFGGLTVTGNIFLATDVAPWFNWLVVKPYGTGHTIQRARGDRQRVPGGRAAPSTGSSRWTRPSPTSTTAGCATSPLGQHLQRRRRGDPQPAVDDLPRRPPGAHLGLLDRDGAALRRPRPDGGGGGPGGPPPRRRRQRRLRGALGRAGAGERPARRSSSASRPPSRGRSGPSSGWTTRSDRRRPARSLGRAPPAGPPPRRRWRPARASAHARVAMTAAARPSRSTPARRRPRARGGGVRGGAVADGRASRLGRAAAGGVAAGPVPRAARRRRWRRCCSTPPGGLTGGDRLRLEAAAGPGARAHRLHPGGRAGLPRDRGRSPRGSTTRSRRAPGARLDWLPQETILFEGCRLRRTLAPTSTPAPRCSPWSRWCSAAARGASGCATPPSATAGRCGGAARSCFADALRLEGDLEALMDRAARAAARGRSPRVLLVGPGAEARAAPVRARAGRPAAAGARASCATGCCVARLLAARRLRLAPGARAAHHSARRRPLPRVWTL